MAISSWISVRHNFRYDQVFEVAFCGASIIQNGRRYFHRTIYMLQRPRPMNVMMEN